MKKYKQKLSYLVILLFILINLLEINLFIQSEFLKKNKNNYQHRRLSSIDLSSIKSLSNRSLSNSLNFFGSFFKEFGISTVDSYSFSFLLNKDTSNKIDIDTYKYFSKIESTQEGYSLFSCLADLSINVSSSI